MVEHNAIWGPPPFYGTGDGTRTFTSSSLFILRKKNHAKTPRQGSNYSIFLCQPPKLLELQICATTPGSRVPLVTWPGTEHGTECPPPPRRLSVLPAPPHPTPPHPAPHACSLSPTRAPFKGFPILPTTDTIACSPWTQASRRKLRQEIKHGLSGRQRDRERRARWGGENNDFHPSLFP